MKCDIIQKRVILTLLTNLKLDINNKNYYIEEKTNNQKFFSEIRNFFDYVY